MIKKSTPFKPPHLTGPLLPFAWHRFVGECVADIVTVSAIFSTEIDVQIFEKSDGNLVFSASMQDDIEDEPHQLVSRICGRAVNSLPFICVVCGAACMCTPRVRGKTEAWLCRELASIEQLAIRRSRLKPLKSPWLGIPGKALERMAYPPAYRAACELARRYESPGVQQFIATSGALAARMSIDQLTNQRMKIEH